MFRDRILAEKTKSNLSSKTLADTSRLHLSEETIRRILTGKTADPGINAVLDIGEGVGLKPYEIFMDDTLAAEFRAFLELKSRNEATEAEHIKLLAEYESLKATNAGLVDRIRVLEMTLEHKEEIIALHNFYNNKI